jgi:hypothetical protein
MQTKTFEIRDACTFVPVIAVRIAPYELPLDSADRYLMRRAGYGSTPLIILTRLEADGSSANYDPHSWGGRTMFVAHEYIRDHWHALDSGAVVDVEFILGDRTEPKESERLEVGL